MRYGIHSRIYLDFGFWFLGRLLKCIQKVWRAGAIVCSGYRWTLVYSELMCSLVCNSICSLLKVIDINDNTARLIYLNTHTYTLSPWSSCTNRNQTFFQILISMFSFLFLALENAKCSSARRNKTETNWKQNIIASLETLNASFLNLSRDERYLEENNR